MHFNKVLSVRESALLVLIGNIVTQNLFDFRTQCVIIALQGGATNGGF